ncbi:MAG TPA: hypothetical protein VE988_05575, partial [Gemmataceae bacterium]|nr:hypothetical protein [Gemmataceae bacterium]
MMSVNKMLVAAATVLCLPAVAPAQQVFKEITNPRLEDLLKAMNISYSKGSDGKTTTWYDYTSKTYKIRLWSYNGKDLMLDVILPKVGWEEVNKWNGNAKFSRARLDNNNTVLESNL